jgi:heme exporter protein CcmD
MSEFLAMGGYAQYVWPAYAIVLAAIVLNIVWARRALARARAEARKRLAMSERSPTKGEAA